MDILNIELLLEIIILTTFQKESLPLL